MVTYKPNKIIGFPSKTKIISVSCGDFHSIALSDNYEVFSWGGGGQHYNKGQCGHDDIKDREIPTKIAFFEGMRVTSISCGGFHTLVLAEGNNLYGFGKGTQGQCGFGDYNDTSVPKLVSFVKGNQKLTENDYIVDFKCGGNHSIALLSNGSIYTWGCGIKGQLGLYNADNAHSPRWIKGISKRIVKQIAAGWNHTVVLTENGYLYSTGCGEHRELGFSDEDCRNGFTPVPFTYFIDEIYAGGHHTFILIDPSKGEIAWECPSPIESEPNSPKGIKDFTIKKDEMSSSLINASKSIIRENPTIMKEENNVFSKKVLKREAEREDYSKYRNMSPENNDILNRSSDKNHQNKSKAQGNQIDFSKISEIERVKKQVSLKVAYSDLKLIHRFVRFTIKEKYRKNLNCNKFKEYIDDFIEEDKGVKIYRLQNDSDILTLKNKGLEGLFNDIAGKYLENIDYNSFTLMMIYDYDKSPELSGLCTELIELNKNEPKSPIECHFLK